MIKPLWALTGVALLGAAGVAGAIVVASQGGEEEVVQQVASGTPQATASLTPAPSPSATATTAAPTPEASPQPVPEDWQTYTDEVLGFSLRYPPDLVYKDLTGPSPVGPLQERGLEFRSAEDRARGVAIAIVENTKGLTVDEWTNEYSACRRETKRPGTVAGKTAVLCTTQAIDDKQAAGAIFEHAGKMFYITARLGSSELEQVLASLRL